MRSFVVVEILNRLDTEVAEMASATETKTTIVQMPVSELEPAAGVEPVELELTSRRKDSTIDIVRRLKITVRQLREALLESQVGSYQKVADAIISQFDRMTSKEDAANFAIVTYNLDYLENVGKDYPELAIVIAKSLQSYFSDRTNPVWDSFINGH